MLLPILIITAVAGYWWYSRLSAAHQAVVDKALASDNAPAIQTVANAFAADGKKDVAKKLNEHASMVANSKLRQLKLAMRQQQKTAPASPAAVPNQSETKQQVSPPTSTGGGPIAQGIASAIGAGIMQGGGSGTPTSAEPPAASDGPTPIELG